MKIQTVTGVIDSSQLGITLPHEHIFLDKDHLLVEPESEEAKKFWKLPVSMDILGQLRLHPYDNKDNCTLNDFSTAVDELNLYKQFGGTTVIDVTPIGIGRNPKALYDIANATGLNIIMGCGYYLEFSIPEEVHNWTVEQFEQDILRDLTIGMDGTDIKAGVIGEIGISPDMTDLEVRVLRGAARAQAKTNSVLTIHLPGWERYGHKVLDIVEEEGGNPRKVILDHMNPSMYDVEYQTSLADRGAYLEYDMIGLELLFPEGQSPSDDENARAVTKLINLGYEKSLLLSQDVFLKNLLTKYGGFGYVHILQNFIPRLEKLGVAKETINTILIGNIKDLFER